MLCYIVYIKNCINIDICFPFNSDMESIFESLVYETMEYDILDNTTYKVICTNRCKVYRAKIRGLTYKNTNYISNAEYYLHNWKRRTNGLFICECIAIEGGNIMVDLYDPITKLSVAEQLKEKYHKRFK